jgi:hypothetical protein
MTRIQRLEERIKSDDKMCERINKLLDELQERRSYAARELAHILGQIRACLELAGRREGCKKYTDKLFQ